MTTLHTEDCIGRDIRCHRSTEENDVVVSFNEELRRSHDLLRKKALNPNDKSVRNINNNRYEVFIEGGESDKCFEEIATKINKLARFKGRNVAKEFIDHCKAQTKFQNKKFDNLSIIITYGAVTAQLPHIDLHDPNEMFTMIMDPSTPATLFYPLEAKDQIQDFAALFKLWNKLFGPVPENLKTIFTEPSEVKQILANTIRYYGNVLAEHLEAHSFSNCTAGTVITCRGGIVHAGPAVDMPFRAAIFGSVSPLGRKAEPYDPDVQYNACSLLCSIISYVWYHKDMKSEERKYLLDAILHYAKREDSDPANTVSEYPLVSSLIHDMYRSGKYTDEAIKDDWLFDRFLPVLPEWYEQMCASKESQVLYLAGERRKIRMGIKKVGKDYDYSLHKTNGNELTGSLYESSDKKIFFCERKSWAIVGYSKAWSGPFDIEESDEDYDDVPRPTKRTKQSESKTLEVPLLVLENNL